MEIEETQSCCGIGEMRGLYLDPVNSLLAVSREANRNGEKFNLYLFTDRVSYKNGSNLASYILKNKLGTIVESPARMGQVGHQVKGWIWSVDWKALDKWYKQSRHLEIDDEELEGWD